jgi:HAD superfamily hydrolase (TIGR01509 family)
LPEASRAESELTAFQFFPNQATYMLTILWDNDGVLVNTEGLYFEACRQALAEASVELTLDQFKEISLRQGESTFTLAIERGVDQETVGQLRQKRDNIYTDLLQTTPCLIDGVEDVLSALHGRVRMGVVTSSQRKHFESAHRNTRVIEYMDFVLTYEDYTNTKPDPEPYLKAVERHDLCPDQCIVIEDSERGLAAAVAAGLRCIVVLSQWTKDGDFSRATAVVDHISKIPDMLFE